MPEPDPNFIPAAPLNHPDRPIIPTSLDTESINVAKRSPSSVSNVSNLSDVSNASQTSDSLPGGAAGGHKHKLLGSKSAIDLSHSRKPDSAPTRSVSQILSNLRRHGHSQRSVSANSTTATHVGGHRKILTTKGGRAIPSKSDVGAFAQHAQQSNSSTSISTSSLKRHDDDFRTITPSRKSSTATVSSIGGSTIVTASRKEPLVYPALLSKVAEKFKERMLPIQGERIKNELSYKNAFTGAEAVDVIAYIIKTPDRSLALLLGRSLDAQKLFHDVTYDSRLRDSQNEIYQFTTYDEQTNSGPEPNGIFTLLSECYSPTCSRNRLCYSIACPRRLEQQARLNMKLDPGLLLSNQQESSISLTESEGPKEKLWRWTVPQEVLDSTSPTEQKRQEAIAELIYTEREFVKALEYLRESWIKPLRRSTALGPDVRRDRFIRVVFLNVLEVHAVNLKFAEAMTRRQQLAPVVNQIADVVLEFIPRFDPFVTYGAQQMYAKFEFERERSSNPAFAKFVDQTEKDPVSQGLELNGYLTKPTTRLARYPLLLDAILKRTEEGNPDRENIPKAITQIREFLFRVNEETGKAENRFSLHQLNQALTFRAGEFVFLNLLDPKRKLVFKGSLRKRPPPAEGSIQMYLFDHSLLFAKKKKINGLASSATAAAAAAAAVVEQSSGSDSNGKEVLRVNSKPIPLELLRIAADDEIGHRMAAVHIIRNTVSRNAEGKTVFPITFQHIGRKGYEVTFYAENFQARKTWIETIVKQQEAQRCIYDIFTLHSVYTSIASGTGRLQSATYFNEGRNMLLGFDKGIFLCKMTYSEGEGKYKPVCSTFKLVMQTNAPVTQIDVVEKYGVVLTLCDRTVSAIPLDQVISNGDLNGRSKSSIKVIGNQVSFYKVDECLGRTLLTLVKSSNISSTIRVLEPVSTVYSSQKRPQLRRLLTSGGSSSSPEGFKLLKPPIEIPSATLSLSFLRSHLCLGCSRGFELLDLETGKFESLLDPADTSLDFVIKRESLRPISLYRIGKEFLLNYSDFSFFINRNGWRSRPDWIIQWECNPQRIVLSYPYLVAFDTNLIEIRNLDSELVRVITGEGIHFLNESVHDILYSFDNTKGQNEIVSLNFWEKQKEREKREKEESDKRGR